MGDSWARRLGAGFLSRGRLCGVDATGGPELGSCSRARLGIGGTGFRSGDAGRVSGEPGAHALQIPGAPCVPLGTPSTSAGLLRAEPSGMEPE